MKPRSISKLWYHKKEKEEVSEEAMKALIQIHPVMMSHGGEDQVELNKCIYLYQLASILLMITLSSIMIISNVTRNKSRGRARIRDADSLQFHVWLEQCLAQLHW